MSQLAKQLIAGHRTAQFHACKTAAGYDKPIAGNGFIPCAYCKANRITADFFYLEPGVQYDIRFLQGKTQHIHHRICLIGIGIDSAAFFCNGKKAQPAEPRQRGFHRKFRQRIPGKGCVLAVITAGVRVQIC